MAASLSVFVGKIAVTQSTCGVSLVRDYYKLKKFNVLEIASEGRGEGVGMGSGRS